MGTAILYISPKFINFKFSKIENILLALHSNSNPQKY